MPVYARYALPAGSRIAGPAIFEEPGSTTWVATGMEAEIDAFGNLVVLTNVGSEARLAAAAREAGRLTMAVTERSAAIDAVTLEVMRNAFVQICNEVTITLLKTAHSTIFNEGKDLSCAIFDANVRLVAQDLQGCPVHIAAMSQSVSAGIAQYGTGEHPARRRPDRSTTPTAAARTCPT